jgi:LytTr DNA-binding domain
MSDVSPTVSYAEVKSTLGTSFWIRADSASDYVLDPAFLRFLIITIGIYALLDQRDSGPQLIGWQVPVLWLAVAGTVLVGYIAVISLVLSLYRRGTFRRYYTPFVFIPILAISEATSQAVFWLLGAADPEPLHFVLGDMARDILVLFLFDLLHVHYVVPTHPLAVMTRPAQPAPAAAPVIQPDVVDPIPDTETDTPPDPDKDRSTVQIADKVFALSDILSVRTEDHYLNVITRTGRSMLRAKLSDVASLHEGRHGVQINRSQWVSFAAITAATEEDNGQVTLQLVGGDGATVSRTRRLIFLQLYNAYRSRQP